MKKNIKNENLFKEYGYHKTVIEALEELVISCYAYGMEPPKIIVWDKKSLKKFTKHMYPINRATIKTNTKVQQINAIATIHGEIKIKGEE